MIEITDFGEEYQKQISRTDLPHIFERFYKGENASPDGVGIGLALSKSIIEEDNGTVSVDSDENGTRFRIKYGAVLERWNLLHDIATTKGMFFEGDSDKSTRTYNYLFRCVTSVDELPQRIAIPLKHLLCIKKVFRKQYRQLDYLFRNLNFMSIKTR